MMEEDKKSLSFEEKKTRASYNNSTSFASCVTGRKDRMNRRRSEDVQAWMSKKKKLNRMKRKLNCHEKRWEKSAGKNRQKRNTRESEAGEDDWQRDKHGRNEGVKRAKDSRAKEIPVLLLQSKERGHLHSSALVSLLSLSPGEREREQELDRNTVHNIERTRDAPESWGRRAWVLATDLFAFQFSLSLTSFFKHWL